MHQNSFGPGRIENLNEKVEKFLTLNAVRPIDTRDIEGQSLSFYTQKSMDSIIPLLIELIVSITTVFYDFKFDSRTFLGEIFVVRNLQGSLETNFNSNNLNGC